MDWMDFDGQTYRWWQDDTLILYKIGSLFSCRLSIHLPRHNHRKRSYKFRLTDCIRHFLIQIYLSFNLSNSLFWDSCWLRALAPSSWRKNKCRVQDLDTDFPFHQRSSWRNVRRRDETNSDSQTALGNCWYSYIFLLMSPTLYFETLASYKLLLQAPGAKVNVGYKTWIQIFLSTQDHHGVM